MNSIVISGTGLFTPEFSISNEELVSSFNEYVDNFNIENKVAIDAGETGALEHSSAEFIEKVSGIKSRFVLDKSGILDTDTMRPILAIRSDKEHSVMVEMAIEAANEALFEAGLQAEDIDMVLVAASNMERAYPAISVELQSALGCKGYGFDMNIACSSATFGINTAMDAIKSGSATKVLMVNPEICSGHLNFRDRDCHFIFGDVCTAVVLEEKTPALERQLENVFEIEQTRLFTQFSNNIRNNFGFLNRQSDDPQKLLFKQNGRKVFKEVVPVVVNLIKELLNTAAVKTSEIKTLWLHQANSNMNQLIARKIFDHEPSEQESPTVLDEYANTSSAGSVIAFHKNKTNLAINEQGVICSFGAGYSAGAILLKRVS
ncbi:MAG TPA: beta-ketoacyl-ACP synthase III [Aeromonadales bacterium]|nr:beta-ketoacyl-ACP synthase III [Aeromonadales bacterium]